MTLPSLELRARQSLTLTPRMQQSVRLLQLSALEFTQEIHQALAENPFLETDDSNGIAGNESNPAEGASDEPRHVANSLNNAEAGEFNGASTWEQNDPAYEAAFEASHGTQDSSSQPENNFADTATASADAPASDHHDDHFSDFSADHYSSRSSGGDRDGFETADWKQSRPALRDILHQALNLTPLAPRDHLAAQVVIESLEDDGYLRQPMEELTLLAPCSPPLAVEELNNAVHLVQSLDRPGIAARTLAECLSLQLTAMHATGAADNVRTLAMTLVEHSLDKLAKREYAELQKRLHCDAATLREVCALIRRLDPKPGEPLALEEHQYIIPDVNVQFLRGEWRVAINPAAMPQARMHRKYADLFAQCEGGSRSPMAQQLQEARWLLRNVEQRFTTIQRVASAIVAHQKAFFDYGEIALKPLVLRDVALELDLHESTVSRATGNKYMATPRGIFEFRHFFPRELSTESGGTCSAAAVRALLKEMIAGESADDPLSDVSLARLLAEQGVVVARRTVSKYRRLMKVPPAEMRRA